MKETIKNPCLVKGTYVNGAEMKKLIGTHIGNWGGYVVSFCVLGEKYTIGMQTGIRTPFARCTVTISEDWSITVEL